MIMNNERESIWREAVVPNLRYIPRNVAAGTEKNNEKWHS
jgi:hypothetical protein